MVTPPDSSPTGAKTVIRHQEAFKLALSMTLFYWLALYLNWPLTEYGAFAIAIISLGTAEASIEKGSSRVLGTTVGILIGFVLLGLFNSNPCLMLLALSVNLFMIGAVMKASQYPYAWFMAAFLPLIVWADTYPHFENAFYFGTFRWLETTAGVIIFSMIEWMFWPQPESEASQVQTGTGPEPNPPASALARLWEPRTLIELLFPPLAFIVAFVIWYLVYLPPGSKVPMLVGVLSLVLARESVSPPWKIWPALVAATLFVAAPMTWLIMPRLSTGAELLTLVFSYTYIAGYLGGAPKLMMLFLFFAMAGISNQQQYSFQLPIDAALLVVIVGVIISVVYSLFEPFIPKRQIALPGNEQ
ncbi:FUSC family protein [Thalassoglobus sp. JC818]|uniref:FUSC family protein n=1 Tax=Thalassoglobus sp. JC818 TaxID=3232136 RepID=UPI0034590126